LLPWPADKTEGMEQDDCCASRGIFVRLRGAAATGAWPGPL